MTRARAHRGSDLRQRLCLALGEPTIWRFVRMRRDSGGGRHFLMDAALRFCCSSTDQQRSNGLSE